MEHKNMKFLYLLAAIVLIIGLIVFFFVNKKSQEGNKQTKNQAGLLEITKTNNANFIHLGKDGQTIFYFDELETNFFKISVGQAESTALTDSDFITVKKVVWSPNDDQVLIKVLNHQYPYQGSLSPVSDTNIPENSEVWWLYDFNTQKASKLRQGMTSAIFSPDASKISYSVSNEGIFVSNPDGAKAEKLIESNNSSALSWSIDSQKILAQEDGPNFPSLLILDVIPKKLETKIDKAEEGQFSPNGGSIVYNSYIDFDQKKPSIYNLETKTSQDLNMETTMEKIIWYDDSSIVAVVPEQNENFYLVTLKDLNKKLLFSAKRIVNALELTLAPDRKILYFTSDKNIYQLAL